MRIFKHPIKKLTLLTAFGGGYVLGARAGRERYEQIKQTANQVKDDPRVQDATSRAEDLVRDTATKVTDDPRVKDVVSRAEDILRDAGLHTGEDGKHTDAGTGSQDSGDTDQKVSDADAAEKLRDIAKASGIADSAGTTSDDTPSTGTPSTGTPSNDTAPDTDVNPLLADEHTGLEEEIVYTSGPDIEESIDQLADLDRVEQDITDDKRDNA